MFVGVEDGVKYAGDGVEGDGECCYDKEVGVCCCEKIHDCIVK